MSLETRNNIPLYSKNSIGDNQSKFYIPYMKLSRLKQEIISPYIPRIVLSCGHPCKKQWGQIH